MSMIVWNDQFSVGIQEIDEQHKSLVRLINRLYQGLAAKAQRSEIAAVLAELVDYTRVHFAVEECLMRIFDYPDYESHKASHDAIVRRIRTFEEEFRQGNSHVGMELLIFLKAWLVEHINGADKQYVPHLTQQGVKRNWIRKFW